MMKCTAPAAKKLVRDAEAAGLRVTVTETNHPFTQITVRAADPKRAMLAEWWTDLREFEGATTIDTSKAETKRGLSLKAARAHVGL